MPATRAPQFILASQSPRRAQLLRSIGVTDFTIISPAVDESHDPALTPQQLTLENAGRKATAVSASLPHGAPSIILAADTLVYLDGIPFGKPADHREAHQMLQQLSARTHQVCTGVTLITPHGREDFAVTSEVTFKALSTAEIEHYHSLCNPLDKAGAYGIQDHPELILENLNGSLSNVIGLPLEALQQRLTSFFSP
jgi:septum formation protein